MRPGSGGAGRGSTESRRPGCVRNRCDACRAAVAEADPTQLLTCDSKPFFNDLVQSGSSAGDPVVGTQHGCGAVGRGRVAIAWGGRFPGRHQG